MSLATLPRSLPARAWSPNAGHERGAAAGGPSLVLLDALTRLMIVRDASTHEHAARVRRLALTLAAEIHLNDERVVAAIDAAALLHDIGKLGIPDDLLHKPGALTRDEYAVV